LARTLFAERAGARVTRKNQERLDNAN
jgi:hypothetical protein